jgi:hypothetical protein
MKFDYQNGYGKIKHLNIKVGSDWSAYKGKNKSSLNSIFNFVDRNCDGKVDQEELDILQKLLKLADSQIEKTKNNKIIEKEELELLVNKINDGEELTLEGNKAPSSVTPKIIEIPRDKDKFKNYTYLVSYCENEDDKENTRKIAECYVDYSAMSNLEDGEYYIERWKTELNEEGIATQSPVMVKMQTSNQDGTTNWSEGINRNISKIQFQAAAKPELIAFMNEVSKEQGFSIELLDMSDQWIEDVAVVRADKKQLIPYSADVEFILKMYNDSDDIIAKRKDITKHTQGAAIAPEEGLFGEYHNNEVYAHRISKDDVVMGKTYLEGGNVLNTLTKDGEPAAVIGEESIKYTMLAMNLDDSEESVSIAKKQIAQELAIKEENLTTIPQFDFHIDMYYRPLSDGQMAVPDYEAGINVLKEFVNNIDKKIETPLKPDEKESLQKQRQEYLKLINKLEEIKNKTAEFTKAAEDKLQAKGYEIVKIPCFSDVDIGTSASVKNPINYMNGICGTSAKTGDKFYITNTSGDENLDKYMENYFKNIVGFNNVYFAPTKEYLYELGGIDCLTKEL